MGACRMPAKSAGKSPGRRRRLALLYSLASVLFLATGCATIERRLLFFPTHDPATGPLTPWVCDGAVLGYARTVRSPRAIWLMLHGNGGQASDRAYALPSFPADASVFFLEYPGYGQRQGTPSRASLNQAAREGYLLLRKTYPHLPLGVAGESLGTGVASCLAELDPPPDKIVLIVAFDRLSLVARDHFPAFLVPIFLSDNWDNAAALAHYRGPVEIFGAQSDSVIPLRHAQALAAALPSAQLVIIPGGHNEWSESGRVRITNP